MRQTLLFAPTLRAVPKDAEVVSHQILLQGGYIKQVAAGIYTYLPLAHRIMKNIEKIVREELDAIGCSEMFMPALQPKDLWEESGRWEAYGKELVRLEDRHEREFCLGPTHEEIITAAVRDYITSYKKLPLALYQFQTKFRDEFRPRFGLMRGREFIMKDLYTFHSSEEDLDVWYLLVRQAYKNMFDRMELDYRIVNASSGQIGGASSEEFMVICDIGEDTIVFNEEGTFASNTELCGLAEGEPSPDGVGVIRHAKGIEVGHIFKLGTKYSEPMKAFFMDREQVKHPVIMGCYGAGISRLLMAILEQHNKEGVTIWPKEVTPFNVHILPLDKSGSDGEKAAYQLYQSLNKKSKCLYDDREERPGVKFHDADLIGINTRIIAGRKASEGIFEVKNLTLGTVEEKTMDEILSMEF